MAEVCEAQRPRLRGESQDRLAAANQPIIEANDPPESRGWCYVDQVLLDLSDRMSPLDQSRVTPDRPRRSGRPMPIGLDP